MNNGTNAQGLIGDIMIQTQTRSCLTDLENAVLECIAYSDLFDFPLTLEEVHRWLSVPATQDEVATTLRSETLDPLLTRCGGYVMLRDREDIAALRDRRRQSSLPLRATAERYGRLIGRLPFVRMVAVTGSLAVENADPGDDLDYLIVTAPGRVWTVRTMIMAIGRIASLRGVTLCPNYLLAETALALPERDFYTARELLQMQPVSGMATYHRMLAANAWWRDFLPNATPTTALQDDAGETHSPSPPAGRGPGGGVLESVLRLPPFDALERWVLARKGPELQREAGGPEAIFDATMCKGHADAWRSRTQNRLEARIQQVLELIP